MSRFLNPFPQFLKLQSGALQPNSDGTLTFYESGTDTLAGVFTNVALTTPADNPQNLDAQGRMEQNVFLTTGLYRVVLKDSNSATIWDKGNFSIADTTDVESLIAQLEELIASVSSDLFSNNYIPNGGMLVDSLDIAGTPLSLSTAYITSIDGFASAILTNFGAGTVTQSTTQIGQSGYTLKYSGVSCTSAGIPALRIRILGADAISLSNKTLTISLRVRHDVGSAVNYNIFTYVANSLDNFGAVTDTGISSLTTVTSATDTTISLTAAFGDVSNGLQIVVAAYPNQAITTKNFYWSDVFAGPSAVVVAFRVPTYDQAYAQLYASETPAQIDAGLVELAERTFTSIVQVPVREVKTSGSAASWTIPAGVTAFTIYVQGGGGGDLTNPGGNSSVTYNSITYTANGGVQGAANLGGAGGTTSANGDEYQNGQNGIVTSGGASACVGGSSIMGLGAAVQNGSFATGGIGAGGANGTSGNCGGGGGWQRKRITVVVGQTTATYTVGAGGVGGGGGNGGGGRVIFEY